MKKRMIFIIVLSIMVLLSTVFVSAGNWAQFANNETNNAITSAMTPQNQNEASLLYSVQARDASSWDGLSNIITADGYVYIATGSSLKKVDSYGSVTESKFSAPISASPFIAYDQGVIFAFVNDGTYGYFEAIDTETMQIIAKSKTFEAMENFSPLTVHEGKIYAALSGYDYGQWMVNPGYIVCIDTSLEENDAFFEIDTGLSYYWNGIGVYEEWIVSGSIEGYIQVFDKSTGIMIDEYDTDDSIKTSSVISDNNIYFGTAKGSLFQVPFTNNGMLDDTLIKIVDLSSQVTTAPVIYNGRIYAGTGDFTGGSGFHVIDAATMQILYSYQKSGIDSWSGDKIEVAGIQSSPLLSTAYGNIVYIYYSVNAKPGDLNALKDMPTQSEANPRIIFTPEEDHQNSTVSAITADENGTIYYTNDSGILFAITRTEHNPATADQNVFPYIILILFCLLVMAVSAAHYHRKRQEKTKQNEESI